MEEKKNEVNVPRRDLLKKAGKTAAFVVPTLVTFEVSSLAVPASGTQKQFADPYRKGRGDVHK